jgi:hypothetical protein
MATYEIKPLDPGVFISSADTWEFEQTKEYGITTFDTPEDNPRPDLPYLVTVGGGHQAFKFKRNATKYYKSE